MQCSDAARVITRRNNGERNKLLANMINAASAHIDCCNCPTCAASKSTLDNSPLFPMPGHAA